MSDQGQISQHYLLNDQYKDASNFNARVRLHQRFSTNRTGWHRWIFEQINMAPGSRVLELGCGPGHFWKMKLDRIPQDCQSTLSDFSPGMLQEARNNLSGSPQSFSFQVIDAQSIPFDANSFDCVIANHMLYHVPDRPRAFSEIQRVLKPAADFYATTNGETHLQEIRWLMQRAGLSFFGGTVGKSTSHFPLENAAEQIAPWFEHIEIRRSENALVVTEAEPLIVFMLSSLPSSAVGAEQLQLLQAIVDQELARNGAIHITTDSGLVMARSRKQ
jgi:ubiquinone/menaquinone biosynthesis C-methylase UbiE